MALKLRPKTFDLELPISKKKVKYRAWTTGEEKHLLMAKEAKSVSAFGTAMGEIVSLVTDGAVDPAKESHIDVLYVYMMARSRSNNPMTTVVAGCNCDREVEVKYTIDLSDVQVVHSEAKSKQIVIGESEEGDDVYVDMRPLSFEAFINLDSSSDPDSKIVRTCIERLYTEDDVIDIELMTDKDWDEFYYALPKPAFIELTKFFDNPPRAFIEGKGKCSECGNEVTKRFEGVSNFT